MELREIANKQAWEDFAAQCMHKTFLHSWNWGDFHLSMRNKVWRFGVYEDKMLVSVALVIKISARRGSFLLVPHGPLAKEGAEIAEILTVLLTKLRDLAKQENADFVRISPIWPRTELASAQGFGEAMENSKIFEELGFRNAPLHYHPESSWKLDITPSEDVLLANMRKTTRYLLRQAEKNQDIEITKSTDVNDMEIFYKLHNEVVKVQKFVPFSLNYLKKEFNAFLPDNCISLFFAKYKGEIISGSFEIFWGGIGFYHHAALLPQYHKVPVSYLIQWEAIKEAKQRGCGIYDFWGYADPVKNPMHPYSGPTLFKMGFGGYKDEYVKTQDFIISKKYWINYIIEVARKIKRGL